jgi:hypothetical protein
MKNHKQKKNIVWRLWLIAMTAVITFSSDAQMPSITYNVLYGDSLTNSKLQNKLVVVYEFSAAVSSLPAIKELTSIARTNMDSLVLILIPVKDFDTFNGQLADSDYFTDSLAANTYVLMPAWAQKTKGEEQHPLLSWASKKEENGHFDFEYEAGGQIILIDQQGALYANLSEPILFNEDKFNKILYKLPF